jgi:hypothetical protein
MTWVGVAIGGGAIVGGLISSQGAKSAASTQAQASENAANIGKQEFDTITGQETPYMQSGYGAINNLDWLLGITPQQGAGTTGPGGTGDASGATTGTTGDTSWFQPPSGLGFGGLLTPFTANMMQQYSPAYAFQKQQGMQGTLNAESAGSGALSGGAQKDLIDYNQNLANTAFNNAFNQYNVQQGNVFNRLAGIAQLGQTASANTGQQGTALAGQQMQAATNVGTAQAAGQVGAANAWSGAASNIGMIPIYEQMASAGEGSGGNLSGTAWNP